MVQIARFGTNPGNLKMFIHVPTGINELGPVPIVVALHGCSQTAGSMAEQSGWNKLADEYGFIVIYPQQKLTNNTSLCFNWFVNRDIDLENGEAASIFQMIAFMKNSRNVSNVFTYGLSAGAAMANTLVALKPSLFSGGAILAGGPHLSATNMFQGVRALVNPIDKTPEEWGENIIIESQDSILPRIIIYQGTKDIVVNPKNADELIDQWSFVHGMDIVPDKEEKSLNGNWQIDRIVYASETDPEAIIYYKIYDVGHSLAVDPGDGPMQGGKTGLFATDIDFFSTYYIAKDFGLIKEL
ncbi:MAG: PHB depolymerase family esterase [Crocinitomicaceae bacterium]|nr:PHB depolymerase family esterase [Crocinitomicaceae bacterium]